MYDTRPYDPKDPTTYEDRYGIRHKTAKSYLVRGSFGWTWTKKVDAEIFSWNQAVKMISGQFPGYPDPSGLLSENAEIVDLFPYLP